MAGLSQLRGRVSKLNFKEEIEFAIGETSKQLSDYQRHQMSTGTRRDGKKIGKYKSDAYAQLKHEMYPLPGLGNVDLKYTGDFQRNIFVDPRANEVVFSSSDPKTNDLIAKYSDKIFGLTEAGAGDYSKKVLGPVVSDNIQKKINGV